MENSNPNQSNTGPNHGKGTTAGASSAEMRIAKFEDLLEYARSHTDMVRGNNHAISERDINNVLLGITAESFQKMTTSAFQSGKFVFRNQMLPTRYLHLWTLVSVRSVFYNPFAF